MTDIEYEYEPGSDPNLNVVTLSWDPVSNMWCASMNRWDGTSAKLFKGYATAPLGAVRCLGGAIKA
jgi:hypothetical protein